MSHPLSRRRMLAASLGTLSSFVLPSAHGEVVSTGAVDTKLKSIDDLMSQFVETNKVPGASLAICRQGKLLFARGYGYANIETKTPIRPSSLFRVASISKPITAVAILQLVEKKRLKLDDPVLNHLKLEPFLKGEAKLDPRWKKITVRHCLQHTGGWDRGKSYDPCFRIQQISREMGTGLPVPPRQIVRYMMGKPLDFNPGERYAYSNLGYLVLGEIIERLSGLSYGDYVTRNVFAPLGLRNPRLARAFPKDRPRNEVTYYDSGKSTGPCLYPPMTGKTVPVPDGGMNVEAFAAHGGWVTSATDLARFAAVFTKGAKETLLSRELVEEMWGKPGVPTGKDKSGKPGPIRYGLGWFVRSSGAGGVNAWHTGLMPGTSTIMVRRPDGLSWAALFNTDRIGEKQKKVVSGELDGPLHRVIVAVKDWPTREVVEN